LDKYQPNDLTSIRDLYTDPLRVRLAAEDRLSAWEKQKKWLNTGTKTSSDSATQGTSSTMSIHTESNSSFVSTENGSLETPRKGKTSISSLMSGTSGSNGDDSSVKVSTFYVDGDEVDWSKEKMRL
jgi:hypothetical protein